MLLAAPSMPARVFAQATAGDVLSAYDESIRRLDGEVYLEDQPIWLCAASAIAPAAADAWATPACVLVGKGAAGVRHRLVRQSSEHAGGPVPRAFELSQTFGHVDPSGRAPLWGATNGLPEGSWEIHPLSGDTAHVLARIEVLEPRGSERSVRDALARAARLARLLNRPKDAADLYAAVYQRYPRTAYLSAIYWGEWGVRDHTRFAHDPGRWMEEVFAHFHDTCFGVVALDRWVGDVGLEAARPMLSKLVGIYPDTDLSRAALRYL